MAQKEKKRSDPVSELRAMDIKRKVKLLDGVSKCLGPKIHCLQQTVRKVELGVRDLTNKQPAWSRVS